MTALAASEQDPQPAGESLGDQRPTHTVVRDYFQHRVQISVVSRAETPNARFHSGTESRTTVSVSGLWMDRQPRGVVCRGRCPVVSRLWRRHRDR
ncbi:hypothetical protein BRC61_01840 [Halobacteriales archaeon QH_10_65_19]|nr:MAG: hypothetical protein BRC61_01840 [Halobacteriales archaeon QH_10_65_19]